MDKFPNPFVKLKKSPNGILVVATACVISLRIVVHLHRRRQRKVVRQQHEEGVSQWLVKYHQECAERSGSPVNTMTEAISSAEVDVGKLWRMWSVGKKLDIRSELLEELQDVAYLKLSEQLSKQVSAKPPRFPDLLQPQALSTLIHHIKAFHLQDRMDPASWAWALQHHRKVKAQDFWHLLHLMLLSSGPRLLGVATSLVIAAVADQLCSESSAAFDILTDCMLLQSTSTREVVLKWMTIHITFCMMEDAMEFVRCKVSKYLTTSFRNKLDRNLYCSIAQMDMEFFDAYGPAEMAIVAQVGQQLEDADVRLQRTLSHAVGLLTRGVYLWRTSPQLAGTVSFIAALNVLWDSTWSTECWATESTDSMREAVEVEGLPSILLNLRTLRCFGRERDALMAWAHEKAHREDEMQADQGMFQGLLQSFFNVTAEYWRLLGLWYCTQLISDGHVNEPVPLSVSAFVEKVFAVTQDARSVDFLWLEECAAQASIFARIVAHKPLIEASAGIRPDEVQGNLELKNVCFSYPSQPETPVLTDLSLTIPASSTMALVGRNGAGKSTIMSLLMRFYEVDTGQILLDGKDIKDYDPKWLRSTIAHVSQEVQLFPMSVLDNLRFGRPTATHAEVVEATKQACAYHFIVRLPAGFNTIIGPHHYQLSGGQKQRLAIARALVMKAKILMLDEATSALDSWSQNHVCRTVQEQLGCTCLFITTRMSAARNADQIAVLHQGQCTEVGSHLELVAKNGMYAQILKQESAAGPISPTPEEYLRRPSTVKRKPSTADPAHDAVVASLETNFSPFHMETPDLSVLHHIHRDTRQVAAVLNQLIHSASIRHRHYPPALGLAAQKLAAIVERADEMMAGHWPLSRAPSCLPRSQSESPPLTPTSAADSAHHWAMPPSHFTSPALTPPSSTPIEREGRSSFRKRPPAALQQCNQGGHWLDI